MAVPFWRQVRAILWKNWLLKRKSPVSTFFEVAIPVLFIGLLVWIKSICTEIDAPSVAYACGQTAGFEGYYTESLRDYAGNLSGVPLLQCLRPPDGCAEPNYYREELSAFDDRLPPLYAEQGYTPSGKGYPFYAVTVADKSRVYDEVNALAARATNFSGLANNPSPTLDDITEAYSQHQAVLVVCPATAEDLSVVEAARALHASLLASLTWAGDHERTLVLFDSQAALEANVTSRDYGSGARPVKIGAAIVVNGVAGVGDPLLDGRPRWDYTLRVNFTQGFEYPQDTVGCVHANCGFKYSIPPTKFITNPFVRPAKADFLFGYTYSGFATLQKAVDDFILSNASHQGPVSTTISLGLFPEPAFHSDDFLTVIAASLALFFVLAFLYPVSRYIRALVLEKETKIKETMKIMGLSSVAANLSWVATMLLQSALTVLLMTLLGARSVFRFSNGPLVFLFLLAFSLALITFVFLLSTCFNKAKTAATAGTVLFFAAFFPYYALTGPGTSTATKAAACLLAPTCLGLGSDVIAAFEGGLMGLRWDNLWVQPGDTQFSYGLAVEMLLLDALLYALLAAYLEAVLPSEYGTQLPWYFPLTPDWWRRTLGGCGWHRGRSRSSSNSGGMGGPLLDLGEEGEEGRAAAAASPSALPTTALLPPQEQEQGEQDEESGPTVEPVAPELRRQVQEGRSLSIRGLRKVYQTTSGPRVAVDSLDLDLYEGQCSVLLGHNGAGKSTTIAMLTGLVPPTAGEAWVRGNKRLTTEIGAIRQDLGLCAQTDTLWPELTVTEHLELFGTLKGVAPRRLREEVARWAQEVGLADKATVNTGRLSGGMKRKLCLAIALIGGSKVIFLDEPTSGMDPYSRRAIWNVLERNKHGRILLLTTHFMDEADVLGDRIAIMVPNPGRLRAVGSPLFLKGHFGVGYSLTVVKQDQQAVPSPPIVALVRAHVPEAQVTSEAGAELAFRLPFAASPAFPRLFRALDARMQSGELRVSTYGISVTTLLEVFLRIGEESGGGTYQGRNAGGGGADEASTLEKEKAKRALLVDDTPPLPALPTKTTTTSPARVFTRHLRALLRKRYLYAVRDRKSQCCQLVLPALLVLLGLSLVKLLGDPLVQDELLLTPAMLNPGHAPQQQNPFPVLATTPAARAVMARLNASDGQERGQGLLASYVDVAAAPEGDADVFGACAVGPPSLLRMSNYLAATAIRGDVGSGGASRYGALTFAEGTADGANTTTSFAYNLLVNASALHGAGVYMNLVSNAILRTLRPPPPAPEQQEEGEEQSPPPLITTRNHPLPLTYEEQRASFLIQANTASTFVLIGMCFIPAAIAIFVVKEAESKAKHQQLLAGVGLWAYWLSNFLWDVLSWLPPLLITLALLYAFGIKTYTEGQAAGAFVALFLAFAPAATAFTYVWSFCFASHSAAQTVTLFLSFLTGLVLSITSIVLSLIDSTRAISLKLRYVFRLFPAYCFGDGLLQLAFCVDDVCPKFTPDGVSITEPLHPLSWDVTMADITFLLLEALVYLGLTLLIERLRAEPWIAALAARRPRWWGFWRRRGGKHCKQQQQAPDTDSASYRPLSSGDGGESGEGEDADVRAEAARVASGESRRAGDMVRLEGLRKVYQTPQGPKVAVRGLSFGLAPGECFGFLGVNGAGKTTTLSMLSGEFAPTSGGAHIAGFSITREQGKLRQCIGYCPQFSALVDALTVREHLELFARIKGVAEREVAGRVAGKMAEMALLDFADKAAGSLSGGNQRKLSVAIATIADPPVLFLDEPSTGMDPASRRFMWDVISAIRAKGSSIILTTHSMEEAEALCTRIGIMVDGRLKCLGTPQHLKSRFGEGWELDVRLHGPTATAVDALLRRASLLGEGSEQQALLSYEDVARACAVLGRPGWEAEVSERGSGALLWSLLVATEPQQQRARGSGSSNRLLPSISPPTEAAVPSAAPRGRVVPARMFGEWFLAEEAAERLAAFLRAHFGQGVALVERASWASFRFSIPAASFASLADLFEVLEQGKPELGVAEYSAGQAQIEVIFNRLCAAEEERGSPE